MIRRMCEEDIPEVARLESQMFSDPWSENVYRQTFNIEGVVYLVDIEDDDIVAVAGVRNIVGDGEVTNVMVRPEYRRQGIAKAVLRQLLYEGRQIGVRDFTLEVRKSNAPAIKVYEELGFRLEGVRPGYYEHPHEDALIYWLRADEDIE